MTRTILLRAVFSAVFLGACLNGVGAQDPTMGRATGVKALLIARTDDHLAQGTKAGLERMAALVHTIPGVRAEDVVVLTGDAVTAENILNTVDRLQVGPKDALICYYAGHGGYDPNRSEADPSGGHFFSIASGDLMRIDLVHRLQSKAARLLVMVSDTCNVQGTANLLESHERSGHGADHRVFAGLMLGHVGLIDISGSARDQIGWFSDNGGWFTTAFARSCSADCYPGVPFVTWDRFLQRASLTTSQQFQRNKDVVLRNNQWTPEWSARLRDQADQHPQVFFNSVRPAR